MAVKLYTEDGPLEIVNADAPEWVAEIINRWFPSIQGAQMDSLRSACEYTGEHRCRLKKPVEICDSVDVQFSCGGGACSAAGVVCVRLVPGGPATARVVVEDVGVNLSIVCGPDCAVTREMANAARAAGGGLAGLLAAAGVYASHGIRMAANIERSLCSGVAAALACKPAVAEAEAVARALYRELLSYFPPEAVDYKAVKEAVDKAIGGVEPATGLDSTVSAADGCPDSPELKQYTAVDGMDYVGPGPEDGYGCRVVDAAGLKVRVCQQIYCDVWGCITASVEHSGVKLVFRRETGDCSVTASIVDLKKAAALADPATAREAAERIARAVREATGHPKAGR